MPGPSTHHPGPPWAAERDAVPIGSAALRLWIPVVVSAVVQLGGAAWVVRLSQPDAPVAALTFLLAAVGPIALIGARRFPGPVAVVAAVAAVGALLGGASGGPVPIALAFALASAVVRRARLWAWLSLGGVWALALVVLALGVPVEWPPQRVIGTTFGLVVAIGLAELIRSRREQLSAFRAAAARRRQAAAEEERLRIARELHDVLAHSLSQINVQAGVGLHLADTQPEKASEALAVIKQTSKTALDDVRVVLGVLREGEQDAPRTPQPTVDDVAALVASTSIPGAVIELDDRRGGAAVPAPVGAAGYRVVQEALTNVARHGEGVTRVAVQLSLDARGLNIEIRDDGSGASVVPGRGLLGMRERVEHLGGALEAAAFDPVRGGFVVRATIPTSEETR